MSNLFYHQGKTGKIGPNNEFLEFDGQIYAWLCRDKRAVLFPKITPAMYKDVYEAITRQLQPTRLETRLAKLRQQKAPWRGPRSYRSVQPFPSETLEFSTDRRLLWLTSTQNPYFQIDYADELDKSIKHSGWYIDDGYETYRGVVASMRTSKGWLIVLGFKTPNEILLFWNKGTLEEKDREENQDFRRELCEKYARDADRLAEREAKEAREEFYKDQLEQRRTDMFSDTYSQLRAQVHEVIQQIKSGVTDALEQLEELLDQRREFFEELDNLTVDY